jgi:hypothetical protein
MRKCDTRACPPLDALLRPWACLPWLIRPGVANQGARASRFVRSVGCVILACGRE